jgi:hypothetical protein
MKFNKYIKNLRYEHPYVYSYETKVAEVKGNELHQLGWWSVTTQKHINYSAQQLGINTIIKNQ